MSGFNVENLQFFNRVHAHNVNWQGFLIIGSSFITVGKTFSVFDAQKIPLFRMTNQIILKIHTTANMLV